MNEYTTHTPDAHVTIQDAARDPALRGQIADALHDALKPLTLAAAHPLPLEALLELQNECNVESINRIPLAAVRRRAAALDAARAAKRGPKPDAALALRAVRYYLERKNSVTQKHVALAFGVDERQLRRWLAAYRAGKLTGENMS